MRAKRATRLNPSNRANRVWVGATICAPLVGLTITDLRFAMLLFEEWWIMRQHQTMENYHEQ